MGWIRVEDAMPTPLDPVLIVEVEPNGKHRHVLRARWIPAKTLTNPFDDYGVEEYDEEQDEYFYREGWYELLDHWDDFTDIAIPNTVRVTHWMPMPEPPFVLLGDD